MLDQNTDRMWYVIGAVIVGAALIFLMNGTFPSLFANVGETFEDKVEQSTEMTDGIRPPIRQGVNLLPTRNDTWRAIEVSTTAGIDKNMRFLSLETMGLKPGDTITWSGQYRFGDYGLRMRYMFTPETVEPNDETEINLVQTERMTGTGEFAYTVVVPDNVKYLTLMVENMRYNGQGDAGRFTVDMKHQKLEKGFVATPY